MSTPPPNTGHRRTQPRRLWPAQPGLWIWLLLFGVILSGLGVKGYWDYQNIVSRQQYKQRLEVAESNVAVVQQQLNAHRGATVSEVESLVGLATPLQWAIKADRHWVSFLTPLPNQALVASFNFVDGRLTRVDVRVDRHNLGNAPILRAGRFQSLMYSVANSLTLREWARFGLVVFALWGIVLAAYGLAPARRGWLAWWLIAMSLMFVMFVLMPSQVPLSVGEFLDHDSLLFSLFMLMISVTACAVGGVRDRSVNLQVCRKCGYNLHGNQSGACPECGRALTAAQKRVV